MGAAPSATKKTGGFGIETAQKYAWPAAGVFLAIGVLSFILNWLGVGRDTDKKAEHGDGQAVATASSTTINKTTMKAQVIDAGVSCPAMALEAHRCIVIDKPSMSFSAPKGTHSCFDRPFGPNESYGWLVRGPSQKDFVEVQPGQTGLTTVEHSLIGHRGTTPVEVIYWAKPIGEACGDTPSVVD